MNEHGGSTAQGFDPDTAPDLSKDGWPEKFVSVPVLRDPDPEARPKSSTVTRPSREIARPAVAVRHRQIGVLALPAALALALATCQTPASTPAPPAPAATPATTSSAPTTRRDEPNTLDGIYAASQATRGAQLFDDLCSECHESADWTDPAFLERWEEASVFRLWYWIYERMPHGNPGTLSRAQVTDALAYILELNGLPAGSADLASDDDALDDYWIIWRPEG